MSPSELWTWFLLLVIEALRRSALLDADLDDIYLSLQHFKGYGVSEHNAVVTGNKPLAVLAICSSGEGLPET